MKPPIIEWTVYLKKGTHCKDTGLKNDVLNDDETVQETSQTRIL